MNLMESYAFFQPGYFGMLKSFALQKYSEKMDSSNGGKTIPWVFLDFCPLGFIGNSMTSVVEYTGYTKIGRFLSKSYHV